MNRGGKGRKRIKKFLAREEESRFLLLLCCTHSGGGGGGVMKTAFNFDI